jgi:hypothetical protein
VFEWDKTQRDNKKNTQVIQLSYRGFELTRTEVLNVRIPDELILEIDSLVKKRVFKSRSEAIREFAREYVQQQMHAENAKVSERGGGRW